MGHHSRKAPLLTSSALVFRQQYQEEKVVEKEDITFGVLLVSHREPTDHTLTTEGGNYYSDSESGDDDVIFNFHVGQESAHKDESEEIGDHCERYNHDINGDVCFASHLERMDGTSPYDGGAAGDGGGDDDEIYDVAFNEAYTSNDDDDEIIFRAHSPSDLDHDLEPEEMQNNLRIRCKACIGSGLTSTVYSAVILNEDGKELKGPLVAVKVFTRHTPYPIIINEVRLMRKLEHPNVVAFVGYIRIGPGPNDMASNYSPRNSNGNTATTKLLSSSSSSSSTNTLPTHQNLQPSHPNPILNSNSLSSHPTPNTQQTNSSLPLQDSHTPPETSKPNTNKRTTRKKRRLPTNKLHEPSEIKNSENSSEPEQPLSLDSNQPPQQQQPKAASKPKPEQVAFHPDTSTSPVHRQRNLPPRRQPTHRQNQISSPLALGSHQIVMEHCPRGNLFEMLHQSRGVAKVPLAEIALKWRTKIILGVAKGMAYLHKCGIVHRDLSSKNVLINDKWEPKIGDLGLAKSIDTSNGKDGKIVGMGRFGTDLWRAPEIWKRKEVEYSQKIDVYSFSIIMWELFHLGHIPWEGTLDVEVEIMRGKRPKMSQSTEEANGGAWRELIEQCWQQQPPNRIDFDEVVCIVTSLLRKR